MGWDVLYLPFAHYPHVTPVAQAVTILGACPQSAKRQGFGTNPSGKWAGAGLEGYYLLDEPVSTGDGLAVRLRWTPHDGLLRVFFTHPEKNGSVKPEGQLQPAPQAGQDASARQQRAVSN